MDPRREWRSRLQREQLVGEMLEIEAGRWPSIPFEVRCHWWDSATLDWPVHGATIQQFGEMVKTASALLGPPDKVESSFSWPGAQEPELKAEWSREFPVKFRCYPYTYTKYKVIVRAMSAHGCKVDPTVQAQPAIEHRLHPECVNVLRQIEEEVGG